jgi:hypothetical protein
MNNLEHALFPQDAPASKSINIAVCNRVRHRNSHVGRSAPHTTVLNVLAKRSLSCEVIRLIFEWGILCSAQDLPMQKLMV